MQFLPNQNPATPAAGPSAITPGPQAGVEAQALIKVRQAVSLLADSISVLKTRLDSDLGKAVITAIKALAPHTPGAENGMGQSEIMSLLQNMDAARRAPAPGPGAPPNFMGVRTPVPAMMGNRLTNNPQ